MKKKWKLYISNVFTRVSGKEKGKGNALIRKSDRIYIDYITLDIFLNKVKIRLQVEAHSAQYKW
jgi:hypothetical protein